MCVQSGNIYLISTFLFRFPSERQVFVPSSVSVRFNAAVATSILILSVKYVIVVLILHDRIRITGLNWKKKNDKIRYM